MAAGTAEDDAIGQDGRAASISGPGGRAAEETGDRPLWCRRCSEPGERRDGRFVHSATGLAGGPDGHKAVPSVTDPAHKAQARAIEDEFGGRWRVMAHLSLFYATPSNGAQIGVDAASPGEMRQKLEAQERIWATARRAAALGLALP